jgi:uncharacterized phage-associated protein
MPPLDPRSVANAIIALAEEHKRPITHLSLQKILYFIHGKYLVETDYPLIDGFFEAWQYGPVHPLIYDSFKECGSGTLNRKAKKRNILTGEVEEVFPPENAEITSFIAESALPYLRISAGRLVDLSHAKNSPWDILTRQGAENRTFGMRITENIIRERFKFHKVSVSDQPRSGEPNEESPPY